MYGALPEVCRSFSNSSERWPFPRLWIRRVRESFVRIFLLWEYEMDTSILRMSMTLKSICVKANSCLYPMAFEFGYFSFLERNSSPVFIKNYNYFRKKTIIAICILYIYICVYSIFIVRRYIFLYNDLISHENRCVSLVEI